MFPQMSVEKRFLSHEARFPLDLLDIGWGGGGGMDIMGGPNFDRLYHKLKVLLLLLLLLSLLC